MVVTRYMGSRIKGLKRAGLKDHSPGIWNHNAWDRDQHNAWDRDQHNVWDRDQHNAWDRDQQYFSWNEGSGIKFQVLRVQGSRFSSFLGSGFKILGKNMGSVTKKYTSLRP